MKEREGERERATEEGERTREDSREFTHTLRVPRPFDCFSPPLCAFASCEARAMAPISSFRPDKRRERERRRDHQRYNDDTREGG